MSIAVRRAHPDCSLSVGGAAMDLPMDHVTTEHLLVSGKPHSDSTVDA